MNTSACTRLFPLLAALFFLPTSAHADPVRPRTPVQGNPEQEGSVMFSQLVFKAESLDYVGVLKDKYVALFNSQIRAAGHRVPEQKSSVFKEDEVPETDFVLAGTLTDFDCTQERSVTCGLAIDWELLDRHSDQVVYRMTARHEESHLDDMESEEAGRALLLGGLRSVLARQGFVDVLRAGANRPPIPESRYQSASLKRCSAPTLQMPKESETALTATALVKVGDGVGSGVFISPDGFLLTAAHVATQDNLEVRMRDGKVHAAKLIRKDTRKDVALLRLADTGVTTPCLLLNEEEASAGENIYAIGAPGGADLSFSISRGILSGKRTIDGTKFLQTDAAINPGNSGGPLLGDDGRVVGIISWKVVGTGAEGLGFGVPSSTALTALGLYFADETGEISGAPSGTTGAETALVDREDPPYHFVGEDAPGQTPGWVGATRAVGIVLTAVGATTVGLSFLAYNSEQSQSTYDTIMPINTAGWIAAGVGVGMIVTSIIFKPKARLPEEVAAPAKVKTSFGVGLASVSLKVSF